MQFEEIIVQFQIHIHPFVNHTYEHTLRTVLARTKLKVEDITFSQPKYGYVDFIDVSN